jgi:hypothetical protein
MRSILVSLVLARTALAQQNVSLSLYNFDQAGLTASSTAMTQPASCLLGGCTLAVRQTGTAIALATGVSPASAWSNTFWTSAGDLVVSNTTSTLDLVNNGDLMCFPTVGYTNIRCSFNFYRSATGPSKLTVVGYAASATSVSDATMFNISTVSAGWTYNTSFALPASAANKASACCGFFAPSGAATSTGGTGRLDDFLAVGDFICLPGTSGPAGACTTCAAGSYSSSSGASSCAQCPTGAGAGANTATGQTTCACADGYYFSGGACVVRPPCVAGSTWSATGVYPCAACTVCASNRSTTATCTATSDTTCAAACPVGYSTTAVGSGPCSPCAANTFSTSLNDTLACTA